MSIEKVKILFITVRADFGGGPEHLHKLSKSLSDDFEIYFASPNDFPYSEKYIKIAGKSRFIKIAHRRFSLFTFIRLIWFVTKNKIKIIHSHGKGAGIYSRLLKIFTGKKVVHTFHGLHIGSYGILKKLFYISLERLLSVLTTKIISVSPSEKETLINNKICSLSKIELIENGVEISEKRINSHLNENEKICLISITRFDYAKNSELLLDVALKLKSKLKKRDFLITILGEGEGKKELKEKIESSLVADNFIFYGAVTNPQYYLLKSHCYISTSRWEGLPLAVMEAMAVGLPIVASNVIGNKDVVQDSVNGLLYELNNPEAAADCIVKIMNNTYLFNAFSKSGLNEIERNFNLTTMVKKTGNLYYSIFN